jgi:hypothetical protein
MCRGHELLAGQSAPFFKKRPKRSERRCGSARRCSRETLEQAPNIERRARAACAPNIERAQLVRPGNMSARLFAAEVTSLAFAEIGLHFTKFFHD